VLICHLKSRVTAASRTFLCWRLSVCVLNCEVFSTCIIIMAEWLVSIDGGVAPSAVSNIRHTRRHFRFARVPSSGNDESQIAGNTGRSRKLRQEVRMLKLFLVTFDYQKEVIDYFSIVVFSIHCVHFFMPRRTLRKTEHVRLLLIILLNPSCFAYCLPIFQHCFRVHDGSTVNPVFLTVIHRCRKTLGKIF